MMSVSLKTVVRLFIYIFIFSLTNILSDKKSGGQISY